LIEIVRQEADLLPAKDRVSFLPLSSNAAAHATIMICHPTDREALSVRRRYRLSREKREYTEHLREGQTEHLRARKISRPRMAGNDDDSRLVRGGRRGRPFGRGL